MRAVRTTTGDKLHFAYSTHDRVTHTVCGRAFSEVIGPITADTEIDSNWCLECKHTATVAVRHLQAKVDLDLSEWP